MRKPFKALTASLVASLVAPLAALLGLALPAQAAEDPAPSGPRINLLLQTVYDAGTAPAFVDGARVLRSNIWLRAQPHELLGYWVMIDPAKRFKAPVIGSGPAGAPAIAPRDESILQDAYVTLGTHALYLEVGQMRPALSADALTPFADLLLPSRPLFNSEGAGFGFFRDIGALATAKWGWAALSVGVFNGEGAGVADRSEPKDVNGRVALAPWPGVSLAAATYLGTQRERHDLSLAAKLGRLELAAEGMRGVDGPIQKQGWYLQGGYRLVPRALGVVRLEGWDAGEPARVQRDVTAGLNWFLDAEEHNKLIGAYSFQDYATGDDNHRFTALWQAML